MVPSTRATGSHVGHVPPRRWRRALVVEDHASLRESLALALRASCDEVATAGSVAEADAVVAVSGPPDLLLLDVVLPDGDALEVIAHVTARGPMPAILAMSGEATSEQAFELGKSGVPLFLSKPISLDELEAALATLPLTPIDPVPTLRQLVGRRALPEVLVETRRALVHEALLRTDGSKRRASGLLGISRQLLQDILRRP